MKKEKIRVLYVDDEIANLENFEFLFQDEYDIFTAQSALKGLEILSSKEIQIIISDQRMPEMNGIEFLAKTSKLYPDSIRILLTAYTNTKDILDAINIGQVYQYITKPYREEIIADVLNKASEIWNLKKSNQELIEQLKSQNEIHIQTNEELKQVNDELNLAKEKAEESERNLKMKNEEYEALNEELKQTNEELYLAKEKAEESNRLKAQFLLNMSHEIKTPMNAIIGFADMLNQPGLPDKKRQDFTSIIINSSNQLQSIVNNILTISALETKQEKVYIEKVGINQIFNDLYAVFKLQVQNRNISLLQKPALSDEQSEIYSDKTKVQQILTNLITNALKFTHEGFVEFGYNINPEYPLNSDDPALLFYVKDTGIGIKPEMQEKIFERFVQEETELERQYGGNGLGLSISKGFVELLGGKIWIESEPGKGSVFYFTIPYKPVNEIANIESKPIVKEKPKTILIAEDEEFNFLFLKEAIDNLNFNVIHAINGKEAVDICMDNPDISLILMDIKMPVMDGHAATKLIKSFRNDIIVIGQSAYSLEQYQGKYKENVFDDFLNKPIKADILRQTLKKYIDS